MCEWRAAVVSRLADRRMLEDAVMHRSARLTSCALVAWHSVVSKRCGIRRLVNQRFRNSVSSFGGFSLATINLLSFGSLLSAVLIIAVLGAILYLSYPVPAQDL
eukprot:scaffold237466_cov28-Prasinocladus_malaysianus.AAC.1